MKGIVHIFAAVALARVALTAAPGAGADANLVANPGFEESAADGKAPLVWSLPNVPGVHFAIDTEVAHAGRCSGRIEGTDPAKQTRFVQAWRQWVAVPKHTPLWLSAWVKAQEVTNGSVRLLHQDAAGTVVLNQQIAAFNGTFDWKEIAGQVRQEPGVVKVCVVAGLVKSTGKAWFDDIALVEAASPGQSAGTLTVSPVGPQPANELVPVKFAFAIGSCGLATGGELKLRWEAWSPGRFFRFTRPRAECRVPGVKLTASVPARRRVWPPTPKPVACVVTMASGPALAQGAEVVLTAHVRYAKQSNVRAAISGLIAPAARSAARPMHGACVFQSSGRAATRITCTAQARPIAGRPGRVTAAMTDEYGNPAADFRGTVKLSCSTRAGLPPEYAFTEADAGTHTFTPIFAADTVSRVTAACGTMQSVCNPILPRRPDEPGVYFGDIHSHCEVSGDGVGDPDLAYEYAHGFHGLDFAALSDHSPKGARWQHIVQVGNRHNAAGRFVTILGYEWSTKAMGHRNIYFPGDTGPETPRGLRGNMQQWWEWLRENRVRALIVPHHTNTQAAARYANGESAWGPCDWSAIDHEYQRVVEICQNRGSFEAPGGPIPELRIRRKDAGASVQTALANGHRLGFIGSTDTHNGRPGTGLARCAIISPELTRQGLWTALYNRSCYATTGRHILLFLSLNGQPMGRELVVPAPATPRELAWRAIGTGDIKRVDLLRNNGVVKSWPAQGTEDMSGRFTRSAPMTGTEWWYLRVIQEDTEMAWSSPIWVDVRR